ncbi:MAG: hypothetical protein PVF56_24735, partial [Desulfobacterales bacterium]
LIDQVCPKKISFFLTHYSAKASLRAHHSSIPSFHGILLRHNQFALIWRLEPGFLCWEKTSV